MEFFRIALDTVGKKDVQFICGGMLQRRKSRTHLLDVPKGIPRNLSESQLVQMSSKALCNVAGQFTKLGQTLNPNRSSRSKASQRASSASAYLQNTSKIETGIEAEKAVFIVGGSKTKSSASSSDSEDTENSIYEPQNSEIESSNICADSTFLPSVGIVMSSSNEQSIPNPVSQLEDKDNVAKMSEDVLTMSISSVTDHVTLPAGLLENAEHIHSRCPTPEIRVESSPQLTDNLVRQESSSAGETRTPSPRDLSLNLSGSQSDNALKQLKNLTSPLSKLAKGMQSLGMNLDPRKIATKVMESV